MTKKKMDDQSIQFDARARARRLNAALARGHEAFIASLMEMVREEGMTSFAKRVSVSRHTLYRYEWGTDKPLLDTVMKMTAAIGVKLTVDPC